MLKVTVNTKAVLVEVTGPDRGQTAKMLLDTIDPGNRKYLGNGVWQVRNPWRWAEHIPAIKFALLDAQKQMSFFENATSVAENGAE